MASGWKIPETGISLGELDNWLRQKLGHDTRVSGEIVRARPPASASPRGPVTRARRPSTGSDADLDGLVKSVAEAYLPPDPTLPVCHYLLRHENKSAEALPIFKRLALNGNPDDRLWSYNMWGVAVGTLEEQCGQSRYVSAGYRGRSGRDRTL